MIDPANHNQLKAEIAACIAQDEKILTQLREEIRLLKGETRRIACDDFYLLGWHRRRQHQLQFDPFDPGCRFEQ